jgi:large subunit ribosomal protein L10
MNKTEKEELVSQIKEYVDNSSAIYFVDYAGVNVEDINALRKEFRKEKVSYKVFKNTLFKKAVAEDGYNNLDDMLKGMTGYAFVKDNVSVPAKIIKKYNDVPANAGKFTLKGCYIEKQFYSGNKLNELANLPTKNDVIAGILSSINAPASGIVGAINAVMRDLVYVMDAIEKKKAA